MKNFVLGWLLLCSLSAVAGKVYPHSVVPGGVSTDAELRSARLGNSLVDAHYRGVATVGATKVMFPMHAYVSMLKDGRIQWTAVTLPAGEAVLTDGTHLIRVRCGNRIVFTLPPPETIVPPEEAVLPPAIPPFAPPYLAPPGEEAPPIYSTRPPMWAAGYVGPGFGMGGGYLPACYDTHGKEISCKVLHPTPEPGTLAMFGTGLIALFAARRRIGGAL